MSSHILNFEQKLSKMGFKKAILDSADNAPKESIGNLYLVADREISTIREKEPQIAFALEQAYKFDKNIYAVYFRHFENNLPSIPQIYIYDYSEISDLTQTEENDLAQIHRNIWNAGTVPFIYVFTANDIIVINCSKQPEQDKEKDTIKYTPFKILKDISEVSNLKTNLDKSLYAKFEEFSANRFDSGYFFENSAYKNDVTLSNTAYEKLLSLLEKTKNSLIEKVNFLPNQADKNAQFVKKFLLMCILVKYLEDRKDEDGNTVFPKAKDTKKYVNGDTKKLEYAQDFFDSILAGAGSFIDIVSNGEACVKLFGYLSKHFLGTIFSLTQDERAAIISAKTKQLALFKTFLEGKTDADTLQINIWKLYSFQYLPVELISNIYENFLERNKEGKRQTGVVYTPPFLVRLLIDQSMPLKNYVRLKNSNDEYFKVLDPSCGSGVFLVAAYCRLVQWWRIQNEWKQPDLKTLKDIFSKSIFGVDISLEAVNVAIFSLTIALLDMLTPKVIWDNLTFEEDKTTDNEENEKEENQPLFKLHPYDFFKLADEKSTIFETLKLPTNFDLVIGNPPFGTFKDLGEDAVFAKKIDAFNCKNSKRPKLPNTQIALLFVEESIKLCKDTGLLCMILPSGAFLYNNQSDNFRKYLIETYEVPQILDFTHIEGLFKNRNIASSDGAQVSTLALFVKNTKPTEKPILHLVFKRIKSIEEKMYFELDKYDFHWISKNMAKNNRIVWKCNYMGGGRIYSIIERFQNIPTKLEQFIKSQDWLFEEGYIGIDLEKSKYKDKHKQAIRQLKEYEQSATLSEEQEKEFKTLKAKYKKASFLTGKQVLPTEAVSGDSVDFSRITVLQDEYFHRPKKEELFLRPFLIIKEGVSDNALICHLIPEPDIKKRNVLACKDKIIIINPKDRTQWENVVQFGEVLKNNALLYHFYILCFSGQYLVNRSTAILKADIDALPYPVNEKEKETMKLYDIEKVIVNDVLTYGVKFRSNGSKSEAVQPIKTEKDRKEVMDKFQYWFLSIMNSVYKDVKAYKTLFISDFVCFIVYKGEKLPEIDIENLENAEVYLNNLLIQKNISKTIRMTKIITIFDKNVTYLIKPNQLRYWLPSIAIRDADEIFAYLTKKGF
jgi:hypothetical protein